MTSNEAKIRIFEDSSHCYNIWHIEDAIRSRKEYRVVGRFIGTNAGSPYQSEPLDLPMKLTVDETSLLIQRGYAHLCRFKTEQCLPSYSNDSAAYSTHLESFQQHRVEHGSKVGDSAEQFELRQRAEDIVKGRRAKALKRRKFAGTDANARRFKIRPADLEGVETVAESEVERVIEELTAKRPRVNTERGSKESYRVTPWTNDNCYDVIEFSYPVDESSAERRRRLVFHDLWSRGYTLTVGGKFGCDLLVYPGDPTLFHASHLAYCMDSNEPISAHDLAAYSRLGGMFVLRMRRHPFPRSMCRCFADTAATSTVVASRDTVPLSYAVYGTAFTQDTNPLVILHGLFGQKGNWQSVAKAMQRKLSNQVFAVDLRNHGESPWTLNCSYQNMAADVERFIEEHVLVSNSRYKYAGVSLLGHSMGGKAAMATALRRPDLINRLLIEDVAPQKYDTPMHRITFPLCVQMMAEIDLNSWDCANIAEVRQRADEQLKKIFEDASVRAFLLRNLKQEPTGAYSWSVNFKSLAANLSLIVGFPSELFDPVLYPPYPGDTLALFGQRSMYNESKDTVAFRRLFPRCVFKSILNAGHWIHADNPSEFIYAAVQFCRTASLVPTADISQ